MSLGPLHSIAYPVNAFASRQSLALPAKSPYDARSYSLDLTLFCEDAGTSIASVVTMPGPGLMVALASHDGYTVNFALVGGDPTSSPSSIVFAVTLQNGDTENISLTQPIVPTAGVPSGVLTAGGVVLMANFQAYEISTLGPLSGGLLASDILLAARPGTTPLQVGAVPASSLPSGAGGGAYTLTASGIASALGYAPYSANNPSGFQTAAQLAAAVANLVTATALTTALAGYVTTASLPPPPTLAGLGAYAATNPSGFQTAAQVAAATVANVSGTVALANGGTGATTAAGARGALGLAAVAASGAYADLAGTPAAYVLPAATATALGGVRPDGATITILNGVLTAPPTITPVVKVPASGAAQTLTAPASGNVAIDITLTANCTLTLAGGTAGQQQTITVYLRQDATAGRVAILPTGVKWPGGTAPTPNTAAGVIDLYTFTTPDAGVTWFGGY